MHSPRARPLFYVPVIPTRITAGTGQSYSKYFHSDGTNAFMGIQGVVK